MGGAPNPQATGPPQNPLLQKPGPRCAEGLTLLLPPASGLCPPISEAWGSDHTAPRFVPWLFWGLLRHLAFC